MNIIGNLRSSRILTDLAQSQFRQLLPLKCLNSNTGKLYSISVQGNFQNRRVVRKTDAVCKIDQILGQSQKHNFYSTRPFFGLQPRQDVNERMVRVRGDAFNVRQAGDGDHVVLCLPGLLGTIQSDFGAVFDCMDESKFHLVCWDPPGHGKSRPPRRNHKGDYYAWDARLVAELMKNLGHDKYSVLGWGTGGTTANALAADDFYGHVRKTVIWGAHAFLDDSDIEHAELLRERDNWHLRTDSSMMACYGPEHMKYLFDNWADSVTEMVEQRSWNKLWNRPCWIKCPVFVIHGENDPFIKIENAKHFEEVIPKVKLHIMKGAGHDLHKTHTEEFLKLVEAYLLSDD